MRNYGYSLRSNNYHQNDETPLSGEMGKAQRGGLSSLRGGIVPYNATLNSARGKVKTLAKL